MTADEKIARHRVSVLELAQTLGNVSEACRQRDMTGTQFYEYQRRFQTYGLSRRPEGSAAYSQDPPLHHGTGGGGAHLGPQSGAPRLGLCPIEQHAAPGSIAVSSPAIQTLLIKHEMDKQVLALAQTGTESRSGGHEVDPRAGGPDREGQSQLPRATRRKLRL
jgi:hypothetical protein